MPQIHRYSISVPQSAIDYNGHVNNVIYIQWMQEAASDHCVIQGWPAERIRELGAAWVARSHAIEYLRPAKLGEEIEVVTWLTSFSRLRTLRQYRFLRCQDQAILAKAHTDWVFVDYKTGRPRSVPNQVSSSFNVFDGEPDL